jgi:hypothetical protein
LPRPRSFPAATDDDFSSGFEFGSSTTILRDQQVPTLRLKNRKGSLYPTQQKRGQQQQAGGAFATRYDFGASLSAALTHAQVPAASPGTGKKAIVKSGDYFSKPVKAAAPAVQPVESAGQTPSNMSSSRPELGSQEYHDLIQKFCYFGSKGPTPDNNNTPLLVEEAKVDDGSDISAPNSGRSSASSSPPSPRPTAQYDGAQDSIRSSRSSTPTPTSFHTTSPRLLAQYRSSSPALHELPFQVLAQ